VALLREQCHQDKLEKEDLEDQFRAHVNRGVLMLYKQVRDSSNLARLIPQGRPFIIGECGLLRYSRS
jgi:hypothetical protein